MERGFWFLLSLQGDFLPDLPSMKTKKRRRILSDQIRNSGGASAIGQRTPEDSGWRSMKLSQQSNYTETTGSLLECKMFRMVFHERGTQFLEHFPNSRPIRTATFLALLGTLGALYDYLSMLNYSVHLTPVCLSGVLGFKNGNSEVWSWSEPNKLQFRSHELQFSCLH